MLDESARAKNRALCDAAGPITLERLPPIACIAAFALLPMAASATDLGAWAQQIKEHEQWTAIEFRDPFSGRFLASRAGTEDTRAHATLTLTVSPMDACLPDVVIVFERDAPAGSDVERPDDIELQIDRRRPTAMPVRIVRQQGDRFEFVQFEAPFDLNALAGHRFLRVRRPPEFRAEFSLRGLADAWPAARSLCVNFLPVD